MPPRPRHPTDSVQQVQLGCCQAVAVCALKPTPQPPSSHSITETAPLKFDYHRDWPSCPFMPPAAHAGMSCTLTSQLPQVEKGAIVAAGALVTPGKTVPSGQIWAGTPAKFLREMEEGEADFILQSANNYAALASVHAAENSKTTEEILVRHLLKQAVWGLGS